MPLLEHSSPSARRRIAIRGLAGAAAVSLVVGLFVGGSAESGNERVARQFSSAWESGNYDAMYGMLTPAARKRITSERFRAWYASASATATATALDAGEVSGDGDAPRVDVAVRTRIFGVVRGDVVLPVVDERVDWRPHLVFPGLRRGETLTRRTQAPKRAKILARNGRTIVSGPADAREPNPNSPASSIAGTVEAPDDAAVRTAVYARGFPPGTPVGTSGLERALEPQVAGRPGGELIAGKGRRLASSEPQPAKPVRSTIDLRVQAAAVQALAGRFGGIAAVEPRTGRVRALAGIAFSAPQPPGSTFKIITATAALEERVVKPRSKFPVETYTTIDGVRLENANGESCGGSFPNTFAHSCNSVFAPLGVKLGAKRLVEAAEKFGYNETPSIPGAAVNSIPAADEVGSPLAVGSTAIGQGKVLATPLGMAVVANTIASGGVRHQPTLLESARPVVAERVTSRRVARIVERLMVGVVDYGTGTAASLGKGRVAGKTGTAELTTTVGVAPGEPGGATDTDAWFAAYAPVKRPRLAVGVLFVKAGAGGETAAPAARIVLQAGLSGR